jgi:NDP-hexose 2,3-enoyl reductase
VEQLDSSLDALTVSFDEPTLTRLDELFPPIGAAPEAWAW